MGILNRGIFSLEKQKKCKICKVKHKALNMYDKKGRQAYEFPWFPLIIFPKYCGTCVDLAVKDGKIDLAEKNREKYLAKQEKKLDKNSFQNGSVPENNEVIVTDTNDTPQYSQKTQAEFDSVVVLKRYKKLLDEGVITQEDFDAKKKEILKI